MQTDLNDLTGDFLKKKMELSEYTEDQAEELLFNNRKWLCGDLGLQLHTLRKVQNLLKVLRHHVNKDITIYPFINSSKELLYEQGSNNDKQDTWELSYRSIVYILFHYGIELKVTLTKADVNPVSKLDQQIAKHNQEISSLERTESELRNKIDDLEDELSDIKHELRSEEESRDRLIEMRTQLQQLL